jgi:hypothetical protein
VQVYWNQITSLFGSMLVNVEKFPVNSTSIGTLLANGQRVLIIASDWAEFTGGSPLALDAASSLDNDCRGTDNVVDMVPEMITMYTETLPSVLASNKAQNVFTLFSMAGGAPSNQTMEAFLLHFFPVTPEIDTQTCANSFQIPLMTNYCPARLIDCGSLQNYYSQLVFEAVIAANATLPNAIYIDNVVQGGAIHTGDSDDDARAYGYVDAVLLVNALRACNANPSSACDSILATLQQRRSLFPAQYWSDGDGREVNWPPMRK